MSKVDEAAKTKLRPGETIVQSLHGLSDGLNQTSRNPGIAVLHVTQSAVVVAWVEVKLMSKKAISERFDVGEILNVQESDDPLPGLVGTMERKNATHALARAMGSSSTRPTLTVSTRRGDISLFLKPRERGELRAGYVAISDLTRKNA